MSDFMNGLKSLFAELKASSEGGYGLTLMAWAMEMPPMRPAPPFQLRSGSGNMVLSCSEVGMGGPETCEIMLADGAIIDNVSSGWNTSADGRYTAAVTDPRNSASFVVYDRHQHVCYHYDEDDARAIFDQLFAATIEGRYIKTKVRANDTLPRVLKHARVVPYTPYKGLWLDPYRADQVCDDVLTHEGPGPALTAVLHAPPDLRMLADPLGPIRRPRWQLHLGGQSTDCWCYNLSTLVVSADGDALVVAGMALDDNLEDLGELWHVWTRNGGWISIDREIRDQRGYPAGVLAAPGHITSHEVTFRLPKNCRKLARAWTRTTSSSAARELSITRTDQGVLGAVSLSEDSAG